MAMVQRNPRFPVCGAALPGLAGRKSFRNSRACGHYLTTVAWSVPAFLPSKPSVGTPLLSTMVALGSAGLRFLLTPSAGFPTIRACSTMRILATC
jgi:hypothetical protein